MGLFGKKKKSEEVTTSRVTKILLAEEDFRSRKAFSQLLSQYGECDVVVDGEEAVECFVMALESSEPYALACLDEWLPVMDGHQVMKKMRELESQRNIPQKNQIKVIMTSKQEPFAEGELQAALKEVGLV